MKRYLKIIIALTIIVGGLIGVCTDFLGVGTGYQYAFNALYMFLLLPAGIAISGILEWGHPEYFGK